MVKETNIKKNHVYIASKISLDKIQQNIFLIYKFALGCFEMIDRCPFFCMDTTASYKLFSRGVNSRPKSSSLWLENLYGIAIGLPSSSHLGRTRTPTTHVMS